MGLALSIISMMASFHDNFSENSNPNADKAIVWIKSIIDRGTKDILDGTFPELDIMGITTPDGAGRA